VAVGDTIEVRAGHALVETIPASGSELISGWLQGDVIVAGGGAHARLLAGLVYDGADWLD